MEQFRVILFREEHYEKKFWKVRVSATEETKKAGEDGQLFR